MPRAGGDRRGSNTTRRARKVWMLLIWDADLGVDHCRCQLKLSEKCKAAGGVVLQLGTITADRIDPTGTYCRDNIQPACTPCQNLQGALVTNGRRHQWFAWKREAELAGIEWDGAVG